MSTVPILRSIFSNKEDTPGPEEISHIIRFIGIKRFEPCNIRSLQIGTWVENSPRVFAVEWEYKCDTKNANLVIDRCIKTIELCIYKQRPHLGKVRLLINFSSVRNIWISHKRGFRPYVCFELLNPCALVKDVDGAKLRSRINTLDDSHRRIRQYAFQLRVELENVDGLKSFLDSCKRAKLQRPSWTLVTPKKLDLYNKQALENLTSDWYKQFPWSICFCLEGALRDGLMTIDDFLSDSWITVSNLILAYTDEANILLRNFIQDCRLNFWEKGRLSISHLKEIFVSGLASGIRRARLRLQFKRERKATRIVMFTPTRMLLDGPYPAQSNRILRQWDQHLECFIRVNFRDENGLHYYQNGSVDIKSLLEKRVGAILKGGFDLCGKHFEFLGYSSSSLRDHDVWFMTPFNDPDSGHVNAARIRSEAGDFSGELRYPARYAARLAQAFTTTDPSIRLHRSNWSMIKDLGSKPYLHTDGIGTISRSLGSHIWNILRGLDPQLRSKVSPTAYQIRFLGFKGVVAIDEDLEGIQMCLRESMKKFDVHSDEYAEIEIAESFHTPRTMRLNRPLVTILEGLGVSKESFINLLENEIEEVHNSHKSTNSLVKTLRRHTLGTSFGFATLLSRLSNKYGLDIDTKNPMRCIRTDFINNIISCYTNFIFRGFKYRSRIPVPDSWTLVGIADEGPAYISQKRYKACDVFTLRKGQIYACIQDSPDSKRIYIKGFCNISRSPVVNPGDVRRVYAIGRPPNNMICAFKNQVNVVVLPSRGNRSLASCLGGGDLDGDLYNLCQYEDFIIDENKEPADFPPVERLEIDLPKLTTEKVIPFVCDFIVEYINSDVLGKLFSWHIMMADSSKYGIFDRNCIELAKLCNKAVDYAKNGFPIDLSTAPRPKPGSKPDWKKDEFYDEETLADEYYESVNALGEIYRYMDSPIRATPTKRSASYNPIYNVLNPIICKEIDCRDKPTSMENRVLSIMDTFRAEIKHIRTSYTHTGMSKEQLSEEELVLGIIATDQVQHRWHKERVRRIRGCIAELEKDTRDVLVPRRIADMNSKEIKVSLKMGWLCWKVAVGRLDSEDKFGLNAFSFLALNVVLDCLEQLERRGKSRYD